MNFGARYYSQVAEDVQKFYMALRATPDLLEMNEADWYDLVDDADIRNRRLIPPPGSSPPLALHGIPVQFAPDINRGEFRLVRGQEVRNSSIAR